MPIWQILSDFVFPQFCDSCGKTISSSQIICKECFSLFTWFNSDFCCSRCLNEIDFEEGMCLGCKRGFFYPEKIYFILNRPLPFSFVDSKVKHELVLSLLTLFLQENISLDQYSGLDFVSSKLFTQKNFTKSYYPLFNLPSSSKDRKKTHLLYFGLHFKDKSELNQLTLRALKKGYEKTSFIFFQRVF